MAPTLSSNSFLLTTTIPPSRTALSNHRPPTFFAKKSDDEPQNSAPFRFDFDFGKLPEVSSLVPVVSNPSSRLSFRRKEPGTVFVAGATGQAGIRIAQALLRQGFSVRAGVPDLAAAQELALLAAQYKIISAEESKRLNAVASAFDDAESIAKAIGSAGKVVVTIGAGENGPSGQVSALDALLVVEAAKLANVGHVAIVYDQSVVKADVAYTLIKTKLTEDFSPESSYNLVVSGEGSAAAAAANDYKVARSQIASLVADVFSNTEVAENKVVQVCTDPSAPSKAVYELLSAIAVDGRRKAYAEALAKKEAEEEALRATEEARNRAEAVKKAKEDEEALAASLSEAQKKAGESVESFLNTAKGFSSGINWDNLSSQLKSAVQKAEEADEPKVKVATVRGQAKARTLPSLKAVVKKPARPAPVSKAKDVPKPKAKAPEPTKETRKVFGGLFKQETIYIDDD
ncbi:protein PLASTID TRANSCRIPTIONALLY ACTIVE 16, chloroplastic [Salvia divinorum]|uniref:Protein PLASTID TRANSCRIPTIONALLY ACTIVE 16, chloroplastic n=1 Tax=Salvia divinorum TaxID=28513 RepID=A0ABD1HC93_SALDI